MSDCDAKRELREVVELRVEGRRYIDDGEEGTATLGRGRGGGGEKEEVFMGWGDVVRARLWLY